MQVIFKLITGAVAIGLLGACNPTNYSFAPSEDSSVVAQTTPTPILNPVPTITPPVTCTNELHSLQTPLKVLFVVDMSGSNALSSGSLPATDPNKTFRGGALQNFLAEYGAKTNFSWGFLAFNANTITPLVKVGQSLFGSAADMTSGLLAFQSKEDVGNTPYQLAINQASVAITSDPDFSPDVKYAVLFMSDGIPSQPYSVDDLKNGVKGMLNLSPKQISFNTIYYGESNYEASALMQQLAITGQGKFLNVNASSGATIAISDVITIPGVVCK